MATPAAPANPKPTKRDLPAQLPMQYRAFAIRTAKPDDLDDGRVALSFSSSNPIKRMSWGGMWWYEVLSHAPGAHISDRLASPGVALLVNHDPNQRAGILEDGVVDKDGGRGYARFNSTQFGKDTKTEVDEKTLPWVSVGYLVHSERRIEDNDPADDEDENYLGTYEADSWETCEVSLVAIPADISVGAGRDLSNLPLYPVRFAGKPASPPANAARSSKESQMEPEITPVPAPASVGNDLLKPERERVAGIALLARQFPEILTREAADKAIHEGHTRDSVAALVLEKKREKESKLNAGSGLGLSEKESKRYDFMRLIRSMGSAHLGTNDEAGFEREVSQTIAKRLGRESSGIYVPTNEPIFRLTADEQVRRRALYAGSATAGGDLVATELVGFLDFLRPALRLTRLGAEFMGGCTSNFALPKMTADTGFNWVGENPGADNNDVDPAFGQVPFNPLGATASTSWTRQLLIQSSVDVEAKVRNSIIQRGAIGIEQAALQGSGGTQPAGLLSTSGVHLIALGANGLAPVKQNFIDMLTAAYVSNAELGDQKYLITPEIAGYLAGQPELGNTIALPTFTYGPDGKGRINGHDAYWSNLLPKTLTKGTSAGVCHAAIGGSFNALTIAEWGAMEIILDPYTGAKQSLIKIIANFLVDSNCTYPQAFSVILDALNPTAIA